MRASVYTAARRNLIEHRELAGIRAMRLIARILRGWNWLEICAERGKFSRSIGFYSTGNECARDFSSRGFAVRCCAVGTLFFSGIERKRVSGNERERRALFVVWKIRFDLARLINEDDFLIISYRYRSSSYLINSSSPLLIISNPETLARNSILRANTIPLSRFSSKRRWHKIFILP